MIQKFRAHYSTIAEQSIGKILQQYFQNRQDHYFRILVFEHIFTHFYLFDDRGIPLKKLWVGLVVAGALDNTSHLFVNQLFIGNS